MPEYAARRGLAAVYRDEAILTKGDRRGPRSSSSQPLIMAQMLEQLALEPGLRVLEIGAGTGYNAALLSLLAGRVVSVELAKKTASEARAALRRGGYRVRVVTGDGHDGLAAAAPYDRIVVTAGTGTIPRAWWRQLKPGGLLELPLQIGETGTQAVPLFERARDGFRSRSVIPGGFMPLRSARNDEVRLPPVLGANYTDELLATLVGPSLAALTRAARRRLLATSLGDGRRLPLPGRADGRALAFFLTISLPPGRLVTTYPQGVGAITRDGRSLALLDAAAGRAHAFGDERSAELLLRHVAVWERRGRPGPADLRISVTYERGVSNIAYSWPR